MPRRVANISNFLYQAHSLRIESTSPDSDLDKLPGLIASLGAWEPLTDEEFEKTLVDARPQALEMLRSVMPRQILSGETIAMARDAALLWGEAFRFRHPLAKWDIGAKPKSSIHYGDAVLVGTDEFRSEFGVKELLYSHVAMALGNRPSRWTLSGLMKIRAVELGLVPRPY